MSKYEATLRFMGESPVLTMLIVWGIGSTIKDVFKYMFNSSGTSLFSKFININYATYVTVTANVPTALHERLRSFLTDRLSNLQHSPSKEEVDTLINEFLANEN